MNLLSFILPFAIGAIFGSFMNVCISRLPKGESVVRPGSHCPSCKTPIKWHDNIPVLSYLALKGKCRACREGIPLQYVIVEILSGIICVLLYFTFGITVKFFIMLYLCSALIVCSFIDLKVQEIPDEITLPGIIIGISLATLHPALLGETSYFKSFLNSFFGVIAGGGSICILGFIGGYIFKKEAMGGGDVKLLAMIGAFLGWKLALFTFFTAPFFGSIAGIILKIKEGKSVLPYGPHLSLAALVAIFYGDKIIDKLFIF